MAHRFEISIHTPRHESTGQPVLGPRTSRIRLVLQTFAALLVIAAAATIVMAIGTAVAVLIGFLVAIAFATLLGRGALDRLKSLGRN